MNSDSPLVAIPAYHLAHGRVSGWVTGGYALPELYVSSLRRAGATPVILPGPQLLPPAELLAPFAGLLLAGGGDVEPLRYGAERHPSVYGVDPDRDAIELDLVHAALALEVPTLAICRGMQMTNVAFGGTLAQHLPDDLGRGAHGDPATGMAAEHGIKVGLDSRLAAAAGTATLRRCTSHHHQGVERTGDGLVEVGWSDDGLVEALEPDAASWFVAVQWHPEATAADDPAQQGLFDALVDHARRRAKSSH